VVRGSVEARHQGSLAWPCQSPPVEKRQSRVPFVWYGVPLLRASLKPLVRANSRSGLDDDRATPRRSGCARCSQCLRVRAAQAIPGCSRPSPERRRSPASPTARAFLRGAGCRRTCPRLHSYRSVRPNRLLAVTAPRSPRPNGARPIEIAGPAAQQFNAFRSQLRFFLPMNRICESVVQRDVVFGDERSACRC